MVSDEIDFSTTIDFFFEEVGADRIESRHDPRNPHSGMVMKKCGMRYEGTLRSRFLQLREEVCEETKYIAQVPFECYNDY